MSGRNDFASAASVCWEKPVPTLPKNEIVATIGPKQKRPEMLRRSCRRRKSAYDKLLFLMHLDLEPFTGAALFVRSIAILRDHPFEALALGNAVSGKAILRQARKQELLQWLSEDFFQLMSAVRKRFRSKISAIAINTIKDRKVPRMSPRWRSWKRETPFESNATTLTVEN
jgi:hypothetical protein